MKENFINAEKAKIDNLILLLNKKVRVSSSQAGTAGTTENHENKKEQTHLNKIDPPSFKGDIVEYADFTRKLKATVSKAGLSVEGELDRLMRMEAKRLKDLKDDRMKEVMKLRKQDEDLCQRLGVGCFDSQQFSIKLF